MATALAFTLTSCEKEEVLPSTDLPSEITSYISTHFPNNSIVQVIKDRDGLTKTYDILLSESISLEFNRKKEIIDIDGVTQLPNSVIPEKILIDDLKFPANLATADGSAGVTINDGFTEHDVLVVEKPKGLTYKAWSRWSSSDKWENSIAVTANEKTKNYWDGCRYLHQ